MDRQRIGNQIGALEEQLELLDNIALANGGYLSADQGSYDFRQDLFVRKALESLQQLNNIVHEQSLQRSITADDFLRKVSSLLIREAAASGGELAISTYGSGRISLEMVELSMSALVACLRASLRSFKGMGRAIRLRHHLFYTMSIYLELKATPDEVHFRLLDDGMGYTGSFRTEFETEQQFQKIRSHIAKFGGWFRRKSLPNFGGTIEFKASLPTHRFECLTLVGSGCEVLLPASCVAEIRQGGNKPFDLAGKTKIAVLSEATGLMIPAETATVPSAFAVKVAVADYHFWIACEKVGARTKARRQLGEEFVEPGSWFKSFGVTQENGSFKLLPLIEGELLMNFHVGAWGSDEDI